MREDIGLLLAVGGAIGWLVRVWLQEPQTLKMNQVSERLGEKILTLNSTLTETKVVIGNLQSQMVELTKTMVEINMSVKSAHKRLDDLTDRVLKLEEKD